MMAVVVFWNLVWSDKSEYSVMSYGVRASKHDTRLGFICSDPKLSKPRTMSSSTNGCLHIRNHSPFQPQLCSSLRSVSVHHVSRPFIGSS
jgi:hypothetical protein